MNRNKSVWFANLKLYILHHSLTINIKYWRLEALHVIQGMFWGVTNAFCKESPMNIKGSQRMKAGIHWIRGFNFHKLWVFCDGRKYHGIWHHHCRSCWELQHRIHYPLCCQVDAFQLWNDNDLSMYICCELMNKFNCRL